MGKTRSQKKKEYDDDNNTPEIETIVDASEKFNNFYTNYQLTKEDLKDITEQYNEEKAKPQYAHLFHLESQMKDINKQRLIDEKDYKNADVWPGSFKQNITRLSNGKLLKRKVKACSFTKKLLIKYMGKEDFEKMNEKMKEEAACGYNYCVVELD